MDVFVWTVVAVLAVVVLLMLFGRRAVGGVDPTTLSFDPDLIGRVRALAVAGQQIAAIRLLRQSTPGLGLAAAKVMVDRMTAGTRAPGGGPLDLAKQSPAGPAAGVTPEVESAARSLTMAGQKIQAIKLVREHTAWGLREAKAYVDGL